MTGTLRSQFTSRAVEQVRQRVHHLRSASPSCVLCNVARRLHVLVVRNSDIVWCRGMELSACGNFTVINDVPLDPIMTPFC